MDTRDSSKQKQAVKKNSSLFRYQRKVTDKHRDSIVNARRDSESDDLPEVTPAKNALLAELWRMNDSADAIPIRILVHAIHKHLDTINPYIERLQITQPEWYASWQLLYKTAQQLDTSSKFAADSKIYSVPGDLLALELQAKADLVKADKEWEDLKIEYSVEIDRRMAEIIDIQKKIELMEESGQPAIYMPRKQNLQADEPVRKSTSGLFGVLCSCCTEPHEQPSEMPSPEEVLREYRQSLIFKTKSLEEYSDFPPQKPIRYRTAWNDIRAQISHHRVDFYRCQSKDIMMQCLRLYIIALQTYDQIYGENPLHVNKQQIERIEDEFDKVVKKVKETFQQMIVGMRAQLSLFYCLQPNRVSFMTYLDNFSAIKDPAVRNALLYGKYSATMLARIFTDYESPERSYTIPYKRP